ncbi:MAG: hypothetical protein SV765_17960 [Pseudomonadota bacterium]|nr:hypothetical protein [Pseudomonadota bacterium]
MIAGEAPVFACGYVSKDGVKMIMPYRRRYAGPITSHLYFILLIAISLSAEAQKVWETDEPVDKKVGGIHVHMEKNFARNADPGAFLVSATDRQTSVNGIFRGVCSEMVAVNINLTDARKVDMNSFAQSRRGADLPIDATLTAMRESLVEQCDQLQVIRLDFKATNEHKHDYYHYEGTLTKANDWRLQDGKIATDYDQAYTFALRLRSPFSTAGVNYKGGCQQEPVLLLEPLYQNNSERALSKPIEMSDFVFIAKTVAKAYARECPGEQQIRFALNPMPDEYLCANKGDCFIEASLGNAKGDQEWNISLQQFQRKEYNHPIVDAFDMYEVLAAGRFDILKDYDGFFRFYFENWFGAYSDMCKAQIKKPVGRKIQVVQQAYDGGMLVDEEFGPERRIWVESVYAKDFDRYFGSSKAWATTYVLGRVMNQKNRNDPVNAVFNSVGFLTGTLNQLEEITRNNCSEDKLLTAQKNMISYARQQPAVDIEKYPTDKEPLVRYSANGPSAPEFTQALQAERKKEEQAKRQRNPVEMLMQQMQQSSQPNPEPDAVPNDIHRDRPQTRAQLVKAQQLKVQAKMQEFQQRIRQANNSEERQALQKEMQAYFNAVQQEIQRQLNEFDRGGK